MELGSSARNSRSFLENANSNQNFKKSTHSRFEGHGFPFEDGTNAPRTELLSFFTPAVVKTLMPSLLRQVPECLPLTYL